MKDELKFIAFCVVVLLIFIFFVIMVAESCHGQDLGEPDHIYNSETGKWEKGGTLPDGTKITPPPTPKNVHIASPEEEKAMRLREAVETITQSLPPHMRSIPLNGRKPQPAKNINIVKQYKVGDFVIFKPDKVMAKVTKIDKDRENYQYWLNILDDKGNPTNQLTPIIALGEELHRLMYFEYTDKNGITVYDFPKDVKDNDGNWILGDGLGEDGKPLPKIEAEKDLPPLEVGIPLGHQFVILHSNWATFSSLPATYKVYNSRGKLVKKGTFQRGQAKMDLPVGTYTFQLNVGNLSRIITYKVKERKINYVNFGAEYFKKSVKSRRR